MRRNVTQALLLTVLVAAGCSSPGASSTGAGVSSATSHAPATQLPPTVAPTATAATTVESAPAVPVKRKLLLDTDVAGDDLVAIAFLISAPSVELVAITISGTGEAHCHGGVDVVLRLLERLDAPEIPVACGRETPLAGNHEFPAAWREHVDGGAGLVLPTTARKPSSSTAVQLITDLSKQYEQLNVLTLGPVTNLADAMLADPTLGARLGPVTVMGGALHVPGNLVCCGAPEGNDVAEWNIYVDPKAAQVLVDSRISPRFVSLDGTNQVPVTSSYAARVLATQGGPALGLVQELFRANPFMTEGSYYLWDPLAAQMAAGYPVGSFTAARVGVEATEGAESGFTRPIDGEPNVQFLSTADPTVAEDTLLNVLAGD